MVSVVPNTGVISRTLTHDSSTVHDVMELQETFMMNASGDLLETDAAPTKTPTTPPPVCKPPLIGATQVSSSNTKFMFVEGQVKEFVDATPDGQCLFRSFLIASNSSQEELGPMYSWLLNQITVVDINSARRVAKCNNADEQIAACELDSCVTKLQDATMYRKGTDYYPGELEVLLISFFLKVAITIVRDTAVGKLLDCDWNSEKLLRKEFSIEELPRMEKERPIFLFHHESGHPHAASQKPNHYGALVEHNQEDVPGDGKVYIGGASFIRVNQLNDMIRPHRVNDNVDNNGIDLAICKK